MEIGPFILEHAPLRFVERRMRALVAEHRAITRVARTMPKPAPWEWAEPRLMPLLAGPRLDRPGDGIVRSVSPLGCALEYGIDMDGAHAVVDQIVAERWERSPEDLHRTAMANLRRRADRVLPKAVVGGTMYGRFFRRILAPRGCASSLVLYPQALVRLLGPDPTILVAPSRGLLLSFALDLPTRVITQVALEFEQSHPFPLMLDPFALEDGDVMWDTDDLPDEALFDDP
jgi:hypothetical protein